MTKEERTGVAAEYRDILEAVIEINSELKGINRHLERLNNSTATHGECIRLLEKWVAAHEAVDKVEKEYKKDRIKNNITLFGIAVVILFNIYQYFIA